MADDKDKPNKTHSDGKPDKDKMPIDNPKVDVAVNPSRGRSGKTDYHRKVQKNVEKEVRDTLDKHRGEGSKKQLEEAAKTAQDAAKKVDPNQVTNVKVRVGGNIGSEVIERTITAPTEQPEGPKEKK